MDKGILRFMAEAYLLLHPGPAVESVAPPDKRPEAKRQRSHRQRATENAESRNDKPSKEVEA